MNMPLWIKPAAYGAIVGGIVVAIVGFSWGGWVTGRTAQTSASAAADASRTDLAAAICVQNFMADENAREHLAELKDLARAAQQRDYIQAGNWATMPDRDEVARPTAVLCARMLAEIEPIELPVVEEGEVIEEGAVIEAEDDAQPIEQEQGLTDSAEETVPAE